MLLELEIGNTVSQQTAHAVITLEDDDGVTGARELLSGRETRGTRSNDGDCLFGQPLRNVRRQATVGHGVIDDRHLNLFDGHSGLVNAEHAGGLTRCRTNSTGELGEVVSGVETLDGALEIVSPDKVVPLGNEVSQRTALMAEGNATIHAPARLTRQGSRIPGFVNLFPVLDAQRN